MWALDPSVRHLNHGSFGATPLSVLEAQDWWRRRLEANPTWFIANELEPALDNARAAVARFIGSDPEALVFTRNASTGVASVLRSLEPSLMSGDRIVTTTHDYNAVRQMLSFLGGALGIEVVPALVPFPIESPAQVEEAVLAAVDDRTRLVVIDHVTSPTALVLPIETVIAELEPDIPVLVDGAHGPGQMPLDLDGLGASWYAGNLHKWVCAPKGSAFLHTRADRREMTIPTVISHGWNAPLPPSGVRYQILFDWLGTDDFSPWLSVPDAIEAVGAAGGGWPQVMEHNHRLVVEGRRIIGDTLGIPAAAPEEMIGSMATIPLPDGSGPGPRGDLSPLVDDLAASRLETLVLVWPRWPGQVLRVSAHLYNDPEDYELAARALAGLV